MEIDPGDLDIVDGEVIAKGAPDKKLGLGDIAGAATFVEGRADLGPGHGAEAVRHARPGGRAASTIPPHSAISYAACVAEVEVDDETGDIRVTSLSQVYDVGRAINPTLSRGRSRAARSWASGSACSRPATRTTRASSIAAASFGSYLAPAMEDLPGPADDHHREPVGRRPVRRQGDRRDGEQRPAAGDRRRRIYDAVGVWVTELPITPERILRALDAKAAGRAEPRARGQGRALRRRDLPARARRPPTPSSLSVSGGLAVPDVERRGAAWSASPACAYRPSAASRR